MLLLSTGGRIVGAAERAAAVLATPAAPTVFVVHEDTSVLHALKALIRVPGWQVETCASAMAFLSRPPVEGPSCVVVDVALPGLKGLRKRVAANWTGTPIVLVSGRDDVVMTLQATKSGAVAAMVTPFGDDVASAIVQAIEYSEMALRQERKVRLLQGRYELLSARERDVMALVVAGLLNKQIAHELAISEITVKAHRGKVMRKMEAQSVADLVKMAANLQLISWQ